MGRSTSHAFSLGWSFACVTKSLHELEHSKASWFVWFSCGLLKIWFQLWAVGKLLCGDSYGEAEICLIETVVNCRFCKKCLLCPWGHARLFICELIRWTHRWMFWQDYCLFFNVLHHKTKYYLYNYHKRYMYYTKVIWFTWRLHHRRNYSPLTRTFTILLRMVFMKTSSSSSGMSYSVGCATSYTSLSSSSWGI
jgi:hypothetical protein